MPITLPADAYLNIVEGLVTSGLYSLMGQVFRFSKRSSRESIEASVHKSISGEDLASIVGVGPLAEGSAQDLRSFLTSAEAESVVRQIYSFRLTESKNGGLEQIEEEFEQLLIARVQGSDHTLARALFKIILVSCDAALTPALSKGSLLALDAKQTYRHRVLMDQLAAVTSNLSLLSSKPNIPEILEFDERFRGQVAVRHDSIQPPHLDRQKKYPIDSLYVTPNVTRHTRVPQQMSQQSIGIDALLSRIHRAVLLGNPGAGKSTFALKVCHDLSTSRLLGGRRVTPILVVLRDYGAQKKERSLSILQFIETRATAWYQMTPPTRAFEYLLLNGRAIVIFDGLDELLETSYRREIGDDIESFSNLYPSTPVIVTSRVVGYEQAPLDVRRFESFRLADFLDEQVEEYAVKWFRTDETSTPEQQSKRAAAFVSESQSVPDLRSNPLMLALMCNIYLGEDFIPTNRPDVYKKCALMLFERWDKSRRINTLYGFENQLSPIMTHIAHWLYSNPGLQSGVTEQQLIQECAKYLYPRRFEHFEEAEKAATDFIEFCRGRAWVFSDTGTTPAGDSLYQFTHRTFLEYFTAQYLFRKSPKPTELLVVLLPRIAKREWDVVAQLAFHIAAREVEGGGDDLLNGLLSAAGSRTSDRLALLSFAGRCLEFISCSPRTSRHVTEKTLSAYVSWCLEVHSSGKLRPPTRALMDYEAPDMIGNLLHTGLDNRGTLAETIEKFLCEQIKNSNSATTAVAAEIAVTLPLLIHRRSDVGRANQELKDYWYRVWRRIVESTHNRLREIAGEYLFVARAMHFVGALSLQELVSFHSLNSIFKPTSSSTELESWTPIAQAPLYHTVAAHDSAKVSEMLTKDASQLEQIGAVLLESRPPWTSTPEFADRFLDWILGTSRDASETPPTELPSLSPDARFGAFLLAATAMEALERTKQLSVVVDRLNTHSCRFGLLSGFQRLLLSRIIMQDPQEISTELIASGFASPQIDIVNRWTNREVNFVRHHGKKIKSD
jgi:hypothetical protein